MLRKLKTYILLWSTQSLSSLGSSMTSYALVLWLYLNSGSALKTALLSVCSYLPYVAMSIFAGALSDKWNKKTTMLLCDLFAAISTAAVFILIKTNALLPWHLYLINALNGLMNTVQQPAGEVAATLLIPQEYYQKTSSMRSFSQSLNTILTPVIATAVFALAGIGAVISIDLGTFLIAFLTLLLFVKIPEQSRKEEKTSVLKDAADGLKWLRGNRLVSGLILFLACINLAASAYDAALPAMLLSKSAGGEKVLGMVNTFVGLAALVGSVVTAFLPAPKDRVRAIVVSVFISMCGENFLLAFGKTPPIWCVGAVLGWAVIPFMNANMDVIFRREIPVNMQGRVFSCRNTLQFFTIPAGTLLGGALVDKVFEPFMASQKAGSPAVLLFGSEKGSGAAMLFFLIGLAGGLACVVFWRLLAAAQKAQTAQSAQKPE